MDLIDAAVILAGSGRERQETATPTVGDVTTIAEAVSDSADGLVMIDLEGESITEDDEQAVEAECTCEVRTGDIVSVTMTGARGHGKTLTVTGVVGGGDRTHTEVVAADEKATTAQTTAAAAKQDVDEIKPRIISVETRIVNAEDAMRQQAEEQAQAVQGLQSAVQSHYSEQSELASLVSDHTTSINQTAAQLQQVATKTEQIDGLSQRVETAESTITQTAESLEAKVSKGTSGVSSLDTIARLTASGLDIGGASGHGHTHIDDDEFSIVDADGNKTSTFTASEITLGADSEFTTVSMCKGILKFLSNSFASASICVPVGYQLRFAPWVKNVDHGGEPIPLGQGFALLSDDDGGITVFVNPYTLKIDTRVLMINGIRVDPTHAANLLAPVVLYESQTPKLSGAVTLSDSLANYRCIEVYFSTNDGDAGGMVKVRNPNGKTFICQTTVATQISETNRTWRSFIKTKVYMASGTTINTTQRRGDFATGEVVLTNGASNVTVKRYDAIGITCVIGYK